MTTIIFLSFCLIEGIAVTYVSIHMGLGQGLIAAFVSVLLNLIFLRVK